MFSLTDTPVKFVGLLVLFAFTTAWSLYQLARRQSGMTLVSNLLHLVMSLVMLCMVPRSLWKPVSSVIPGSAFAVFFGLVTLWFVGLGVRTLGRREPSLRRHAWHAFGHGGMFGAMAWHLSAMAAMAWAMSPRGMSGGEHAGHGGHAGHAPTGHLTQQPGMGGTNGDPAQVMWVAAVIGIPFMTYLLAASVLAIKNAIRPGADIADHAGHRAAGHGHYEVGNPRLGALAEFAMVFGMFWMSTGLMVALLPFFKALSF
ncbi:DUF5134 domain-containing protein [Enemella dayhoffiae]|uniref:DUF5134 domain-containing protein n=1 Tax=Enemella dayhoffiae TaxID=2016507 RepID=UPI0015953D62|nr:DUF5134 domain-containing protein [Enemella dayhoffiae]